MGKLTSSSDPRKVILIGDVNGNLLDSLLENGSSMSRGSSELWLDTKYYTACLKVISLKTVEKINEWKLSTSNVDAGAVIYNYDGDFRSIEQLKLQMSIWQAEIQVVVCKRLERSADWVENLCRFCSGEQIELVELDPDSKTIEELNGYRELYGIPRIRQILECGDWSSKIMKRNSGSVSSPSKKCSDDSFDEEFGSKNYDMTAEDKKMILKLFGDPKVSFDSLMGDVDVPDPAVIEHFRQEREKLKRQNKLAASKRRKKKKSKVATMSEFGEFVGASSSTQIRSDASMQNSSNVMNSAKNEYTDVNVQGGHESNGDNCKNYAKSSEKNSRELSSVSRAMIDELFDRNVDKQGTSLVNKIHAARSALLKMPFGPERQNLAADTMVAVIKSIGDTDLFNSSSDDEPPT
ncbi:unnamed protein product [Litomosoides sigmodontis]|uniref:BZIP domain-containing protein n=1 Tax=Litomosoides sigmodontis TaxID=42156 RepID=A0A3P6SM74_LITSI|nr:unnamed protein product [Litomosoides sigmodontis]